jgi:hypothetical protein
VLEEADEDMVIYWLLSLKRFILMQCTDCCLVLTCWPGGGNPRFYSAQLCSDSREKVEISCSWRKALSVGSLLSSPIALVLIRFDTPWMLSRGCILVILLSRCLLDLGLGLGQTASAPPPSIHHWPTLRYVTCRERTYASLAGVTQQQQWEDMYLLAAIRSPIILN